MDRSLANNLRALQQFIRDTTNNFKAASEQLDTRSGEILAKVASGNSALLERLDLIQESLASLSRNVETIRSFLMDDSLPAPQGFGPTEQIDQKSNVTQRPTE